MAETFDTGPLSWVKDEIDLSLAKVRESFFLVGNQPEEVATLRFTIAHLYQVSGALDMVGLEGCKRYCTEIEKLTDKLVKQEVAVSSAVMDCLIQAVDMLSRYLQDLLNGMPDVAIKLYGSLKPVVELQGETLDVSELFFPDSSCSLPKDLVTNPIEEASVPIFVAEQRSVFQKALLDWLRNKDADSLNLMRSSIASVLQVPQKNAFKTLWWVATAFTDALAEEKVSGYVAAKKLCSRLDNQLRNMSLGKTNSPSQLLRNILYYVAISDSETEAILKVKKAFDLDQLLPQSDQLASAALTATESAALGHLRADLPNLKDFWTGFSDGSHVGGLSEFVSKIDYLASVLDSLSDASVIKLNNAIQAASHALLADESKVNETAVIEVAASLNLLEYIAEHYRHIDDDATQKISTQTSRLQSIVNGVPLTSAVEAFATIHLDANVVEAVAKQIVSALEIVEKALDTFFRNSENTAVLDDATKPLQQITAAFDMLEMAVPRSITQLSMAFVKYFGSNAHRKNQKKMGDSHFELVAESLSMLGLYAEELPNVRSESELALLETLQRLEQGVVSLDLSEEAERLGSDNLEGVDTTLDLVAPVADVVVRGVDCELAADVQDKAIDAELQEIFLTEAETVLASIAQNIQALRVNATDSEPFIELRRAYHTLKGSGRTVGLVGMADVAWAVEKLLNLVIEHKVFPTSEHLDFAENVSAEFSGWISELQANHVVTMNPVPFQKRGAELELEFERHLADVKPKPQKEEVLIGGTRTLSKAFFNIFLTEAQQHLEVLKNAQSALLPNVDELPSDASCRAAHTLGSNALTAGFKPTGDLARALENWLDEHTGHWLDQHIALYGNVIKALEDGLEKARQLKNPKSTRALILALAESTVAMQLMATQQADAAVLELEREIAEEEKKAAKKAKAKNKSQANQLKESESVTPALDVDVPTNLTEGLGEEIESESQQDEEKVANASEKLALSAIPLAKTTQANKSRDLAIDQELLGLFVEEARELIPQIGRDLRSWHANPQEVELADSLQRLLHTLKGSARMAGQIEVGDSVHGMEDRVIRALRNEVAAADFDEIFAQFDHIGYLLEDITGSVKGKVEPPAGSTLVAKSKRTIERKSQFLRMRADVLDRLINEAGEVSIMRSRMDREMQNFKLSSADLTDSIGRMRTYLRELEIEAETQMQSRMSHLQEVNETFDPLEFDRFTRLQELTRMMAESVNDVATIQHGLMMNLDQTDAALQQQNRMNRELQQGLMSARMLPFATISERLQRIVRQTARELNKHAEMTIEGESIELDRGVLDKMGAPLEHLLRNAVAHGLESTEDRIKLGKSDIGKVKLKVSQENDEITVVVTDDGAGINLEKVKQKALEQGMIKAEQNLTDQALMAIIFEPGFTTADTVSQISGRGVGLDVVRSDIAALSGRIEVSNVVGTGAMFNIYLPVTLSVAQVVMARVGQKMFAIPSVMVEQVQKLKPSDLAEVYQAQKVTWANQEYPIHYLSKLIGDYEHVAQQHTYTPLVLLRSGTYRTALHVDEIIGNQEVVMKQIGTQLARVPGMIGATVLGDGAIVLVINPVQLANREALSIGAIKVHTTHPVVEQVKKVALVVDDSLTMRKVLSRVLEREDFEVTTANDGMDAIQKLQTLTPDIILTDIEMPRMDGFEFSRHVRDDVKTSHIPVIVISSRTAEKHRNVAKELGVNAFLGKPVQDEELMAQVNALLNPK